MRVCSIDGCEKKHKGHGFCSAHYQRFKKHGNPLGGKTQRGKPREFLNNLPKTNDCIEWPFYLDKNGYPTLSSRRSGTNIVHRIVCQEHHGNVSDKKLDAAHSCGNRSCVNPRHISWKTRKENILDKLQHGTWGVKLSEIQILKIRKDRRSQREIAAEYKIHQGHVSKIKSNKRWKEV